MKAIKRGAMMALDECQFQFKGRRWNCSTINSPQLFARLPEFGLRESAFIYALSSAALTHSITQACSDGKIVGCSCDTSLKGFTQEGYKWEGCSDNVGYGQGISEKFLDPRIKNRTNILLINIHNNEAGRQLIERNMQKQCKCHGVSGSCELKTCWRSMPTFKQIGAKLKEKFDAATEIKVKRSQTRRKLIPRNQQFKKLTTTDLVYLNRSPDYCEPNTQLASFGTHGRVCNRTSRGIDGCNLLCCGRQYYTTIEHVKYKCNCTFVWCCTVNCQECNKIEQVTKCM